jgi:hypothetical protein
LTKCYKDYKTLLITQSTNASILNPICIEKRQAVLVMPKIIKETKEIRDLEAAMVVYMGGRPFNTYENKYMERFITNALQSTYNPLSE